MAICGVRLHKCACGIEKGVCDGRHMCADPMCGGSWKEKTEDVQILLMPFRLSWIRQAAATYEILDAAKSWDERRDLVHAWQLKLDY